MTYDVEAVVLSRQPYSDNCFILNLYTREEGRVAVFLRNNARRPSAGLARLHPLALVRFTLDGTGRMPRVKKSESLIPLNAIPFDPVKSSLAMFLAEMLYLILKEHCAESSLYDFIKDSVCFLDTAEDSLANFHLVFLSRLAVYLGISPNLEQEGMLDLREGYTRTSVPFHGDYMDIQSTSLWRRIMACDYTTMGELRMTREDRAQLLRGVIKYFQLQMPEIRDVKSLSVITQLFD